MWERQVHGFLELAKRQRQVCRIIHNQYMQGRARKKNHSTWLAICIILSQLCWGKCKGRAHICPLLHTAVSLAQVLPSKECHLSYQTSPPSLKHSISVIWKKGHMREAERLTYPGCRGHRCQRYMAHLHWWYHMGWQLSASATHCWTTAWTSICLGWPELRPHGPTDIQLKLTAALSYSSH